ncbi:unnamed protein product [Ranitomeya imitator]|uniref:GIY-YIG domain-containing protein n=1 Tax=Ranitomeya imitator TaxID=111125 RepID=A0ABN9LLT9_9NEOB|nr:unnamed protein product [Ranitomeya imitator]
MTTYKVKHLQSEDDGNRRKRGTTSRHGIHRKSLTLVHADIGPSRAPSSQRFLCNPKKGTFPCLNCNQCSNVLKGDTIYHPHTGRQYNIDNFFTCNSNFVVCLIKCPCGLLYVGETTQAIKDRILKHKSTIRCKNLLLPIPHHFCSKRTQCGTATFSEHTDEGPLLTETFEHCDTTRRKSKRLSHQGKPKLFPAAPALKAAFLLPVPVKHVKG